jgi:hypothetical protein
VLEPSLTTHTVRPFGVMARATGAAPTFIAAPAAGGGVDGLTVPSAASIVRSRLQWVYRTGMLEKRP